MIYELLFGMVQLFYANVKVRAAIKSINNSVEVNIIYEYKAQTKIAENAPVNIIWILASFKQLSNISSSVSIRLIWSYCSYD